MQVRQWRSGTGDGFLSMFKVLENDIKKSKSSKGSQIPKKQGHAYSVALLLSQNSV